MAINQNDIVIPEGLTGTVEEKTSVKDKYEILSDSAGVGEHTGAADYPVVQITSAVALDAHGGAYGFDSNKPFSVKADCAGQKFVIGDISSLPPSVMSDISKQALAEISKQGSKLDAGKVVAKLLQKYLAATFPNGERMDTLNTWVNDGHDPFQRVVKLPPPAIAYQLNSVKKGNANMSHFAANTQGYQANAQLHAAQVAQAQAAANSSFGMGPGGAQFGPPKTNPNIAAARQAGRPMQPPMPQAPMPPSPITIPPPAETLTFHLAGATIQSNFHFAQIIDQETVLESQLWNIPYLVLVRNNLAVVGGDRFIPGSPAPGTTVGVSLPNGEYYEIENLVLRFSIKSTDYIILLMRRPAPEPQPGDIAAAQEFSGELDPMPLGAPSPMTAEDAITNLTL